MHILATQLATLEEADVAVDLGQSPAEIVVLSFSDTDLSALAAAWQRDAEALPTLRLASLKRLRHPMSVDLYVDNVVARAKIVIVRCLGGLDYWRYGLERIADAARDHGVLFAALPGDDRSDARLAAMSTMPAAALDLLDRFFREGGPDNLNNGLRFAATLLGRRQTWQPPVPIGPISVLGEVRDGRQYPRSLGRVRPRPVAGRSCDERRAARARWPPADPRDLVQGGSTGRPAPGIRQRPPSLRTGSRRLCRAPRGGVGAACGQAAPRAQGRPGAVGLSGARRPRRLRRRPRHHREHAGDPEPAARRGLRHRRPSLAGGRHRAAARSLPASSAVRQGHRADPARPRRGLSRHLGRAVSCLRHDVCLAA